MDTEEEFLAELQELENIEPEYCSLSGQVLSPNDDPCDCEEPIHRQSLDVERAIEWITTRKHSAKFERACELIKTYFRPRLDHGKKFHCLAHKYLMERYGWSRTDVIKVVEHLRNYDVIDIVFQASKSKGRPPIYKVNSFLTQADAFCGACGRVHRDVLECVQLQEAARN